VGALVSGANDCFICKSCLKKALSHFLCAL
jgi:hypothetical protein